MNDPVSTTKEILVVGAGVAAATFVECLLRDPDVTARITVIGDEAHAPYDRSGVAGIVDGVDSHELLIDSSVFRDARVRLITDDRVLRIDRSTHSVRTRSRRDYFYDTLVLATGSYAARVAVDGARLPGCFLLHTIDDAVLLRAFLDSRTRELGRPLRGVVIGGGRSGLEAAVALRNRGVDTTVVQYQERLMPRQFDAAGAALMQRLLVDQGITVRTRTRTTRIDENESGAVASLEFQDGSFQLADVVVFTVGVRARDELARNLGLDVDPEGGVLIDERCGTSDPDILAIGQVARRRQDRLTSPADALSTAEVAAMRVREEKLRPLAQEDAERVSIAGVHAAWWGDSLGHTRGAVEVVVEEHAATGTYRKLVLTDDAQTVLGGVFVGDTRGFETLRTLVGQRDGHKIAPYLVPSTDTRQSTAAVCEHIGLTLDQLSVAVRAAGLCSFSALGARFGWEVECASCTRAIALVLAKISPTLGIAAAKTSQSESNPSPIQIRPELLRTLSPTVAQGTLSAAQLIEIGRIATEFDLQPQIAGDRIELRGTSSDQEPVLRERLTRAGLTFDRSAVSPAAYSA